MIRRVALVCLLLITSAQSQTTTSGARTRNNRGVALMTQQNFSAALAEFTAAASAVNRGIALLALGRNNEAEQALRQALTANPDNPRAHYNLGLLYRSSGKAVEALQEFQAVRRLDPNDAYTTYFIAVLHFQNGDFQSAADDYARTCD